MRGSSPEGSTRRPARRMVPERRREHLIETALELYNRLPPEQVTVEDVTRAADVSRALFYRYFANVGELHVAALGSVVEELTGRITAPPGGTLVEQLRAAIDEFMAVVERHASAYVALLRSGSVFATGRTDALVDSVRHHIIDLLIERSGVTDPSPLVMATLRGWVALAEGSSVAWIQQPMMSRDELLDWLTAQLPAMLAVTAQYEGSAAIMT
ncbi:TetR/AcrR family transcriptional regulator [Pseudonocardia sp. GCM10023141]|uniref:TetR/AcrR family transcriptional regulator n=1 Tax=Pseudonocardia sp. GCM10023141 TaxID=3252653 RepID=UPI00361746F3